MATSKTLTPTNVTIQIPAFADKPDQRANSNCIDKEADAINALSDKMVKFEVTSLTNTQSILTVAFDNSLCPANSVRWFNLRNSISTGVPNIFGFARVNRRTDTVARIDIYSDNRETYINASADGGSTWNGWKKTTLTDV